MPKLNYKIILYIMGLLLVCNGGFMLISMLVSLYRYNPEVDDSPYMKEYQVDLPAGKDLMVLDVLQLLKEQDSSIAYRRSCREGVCGSDAMNINGRNGLACITPLASLKQPIKLNPLPGMPVIEDRDPFF